MASVVVMWDTRGGGATLWQANLSISGQYLSFDARSGNLWVAAREGVLQCISGTLSAGDARNIQGHLWQPLCA